MSRVIRENGQVLESQVLPENIVVCNLNNWHHRPPRKKSSNRPRIWKNYFSRVREDEKIVDVHVNYYYGFSGEIGGGFYERKEPEERKQS